MLKPDSILSQVEIAKPCSANWDEMTGDDRERACGQCNLSVYNISKMNTVEAEKFLSERLAQGRVCIRLFKRADGTIITDNCPKGLRAARDAAVRLKHKIVAAVTLAFAFTNTPSWATDSKQVLMGRTIPVKSKESCSTNSQMGPNQAQTSPERKAIMGDVAIVTPVANKALNLYKEEVEKELRNCVTDHSKLRSNAIVELSIDKDGTVKKSKLIQSCGSASRDNEILDAIKKHSQLKAPPASNSYPIEWEFKI